jgi:hypothetical protein
MTAADFIATQSRKFNIRLEAARKVDPDYASLNPTPRDMDAPLPSSVREDEPVPRFEDELDVESAQGMVPRMAEFDTPERPAPPEYRSPERDLQSPRFTPPEMPERTGIAQMARDGLASVPGVEAAEAERFAQEFERGRRSGINMPLLVTGLSLMASKTPNFLGALGESGLAGLSVHMRERDKEAENQFKAFELRARGRELDRSDAHRTAERNLRAEELAERREQNAHTRAFNVWSTEEDLARRTRTDADREAQNDWERRFNLYKLHTQMDESAENRRQRALDLELERENRRAIAEMRAAQGGGAQSFINSSQLNVFEKMIEADLGANNLELSDAMQYFNAPIETRSAFIASRARDPAAQRMLVDVLDRNESLFREWQQAQAMFRAQMALLSQGATGGISTPWNSPAFDYSDFEFVDSIPGSRQ